MKSNDFEGYFEQIAVTKGGNAQTACGSFPGIYTRLDDPDVFRWMQSVIFGTTPTVPIDNHCNPDPCGSNADCENDDGRAVCRCRDGYEGNSLSSFRTLKFETNFDCR